ncbi:hypothetical protein CAPTEDRAFT_120806, partial [Capitella teleta]
NKWNELPPMLTARSHHSSILYNNHLYIVGGINGNDFLDSAEELDMENLRWSRLPPLPHPVCQTCLAIVSNKLLVFGGFRAREENKTIEKYSPSTDTWSEWTLKMPMKDFIRFVVRI